MPIDEVKTEEKPARPARGRPAVEKPVVDPNKKETYFNPTKRTYHLGDGRYVKHNMTIELNAVEARKHHHLKRGTAEERKA